MAFRITYSVLNADMSELHKEFDSTLAKVRLGLGKEYPYWMGGKAGTSGQFLEDFNPANTDELLGRFHKTPSKEMDRMMEIARGAQVAWGHPSNWKERIRILRKAADLISERRLEIAVCMGLECGKNRLECLGDVEEGADLLRYYAGQLEEANGFVKPMGKLSPNENAVSILKPFGVFLVVAPFNFPLALVAGMCGGALLGGNSVVLKPSRETPWCSQKFYECMRDAGLPEGVLQVVHGTGSEMGDVLIRHRAVDGIVFTGSYEVGMKIMREFSTAHPKPCILEMGGKNPAIICESADLTKAVEGCWRSAFGATGQKCSALSRIYVHKKIKEDFLDRLCEKTMTTVIGDPTDKSVFMGPLITERSLKTHLSAIQEAKKDGKILCGGEDIRKDPKLAKGHFAQPTIVEVPRGHRFFRDELFTPFLAVDTFEKLEDAIEQSNQANYGLTAGIFSAKKEEIDTFMDKMHSGILYANRGTGATTGAWPGVQPFCGWKGSGSTGKGGCGPYYVAQFMREQSQTRME
ncbi:MAG: aldehyde dehydrogenase family protein [Deltaproteobacteria bacterium]|nr:aldehyde dehydrogenase family protein [Deltaproteobacteria bacterium]